MALPLLEEVQAAAASLKEHNIVPQQHAPQPQVQNFAVQQHAECEECHR